MEKVSAVILSFHRPDNIKIILKELEQSDLIDEIIVWHCNPATQLSERLNSAKTRVINTDNRYGMQSRWHASVTAKNQTIYMQDDDLLVPSEAIDYLYQKWQAKPEILHGFYGRNFSFKRKYLPENCYGKTDMVITPCIFFHQKYAQGMIDGLSKYSAKISELVKNRHEDILFNFYVMSKSFKNNSAYRPLVEIIKLKSNNALSAYPEHISERTMLLRYCLDNIIPKKLVISRPGQIIIRYFSRLKSYFDELIKERSPKETILELVIYPILVCLNASFLIAAIFYYLSFIYFLIIFCFSILATLIIESYLRIQHNIDRKYEEIISVLPNNFPPEEGAGPAEF